MTGINGMDINIYQKLAERTINKDLNDGEREKHALFGMVGELGEILSMYQKEYQGHAIDETHLKKELGDLLWFMAEYCTANGWEMAEIGKMNIEKLIARYPQGFTKERSLNREEFDA